MRKFWDEYMNKFIHIRKWHFIVATLSMCFIITVMMVLTERIVGAFYPTNSTMFILGTGIVGIGILLYKLSRDAEVIKQNGNNKKFWWTM